MKNLILSLSVAILPMLAQGGVNSEAMVKGGKFKLYEEANVEPSENCDIFHYLKLESFRFLKGYGKASLKEKLLGNCRIYVHPKPRSYFVKASNIGCGSTKYIGITDGFGEASLSKIVILDHRNRYCRDLQPAQIIVTETVILDNGTSETNTWYSYDGDS